MKKAAQAITRLASPREAQAWLRAERANRTVGFVPTMGALHQGHLELVRRARRENDLVVVSLFVNPLQFDDPRDLERYPRTPEKDAALLESVGCDVVFSGELLGPNGFFPEASSAQAIAQRDPGPGALGLEGELRSGHFEGVATIVERLFQVVAPTRAYFGQKDFQQTRVVLDLDAACEVVVCGIEREAHGLARSSRNELLSADVRANADCLVHTLEWGATLFVGGVRQAAVLRRGMAAYWADHAPASFELEYVAVRDPRKWSADEPVHDLTQAVALIAVRVPGPCGGSVRLIDNLLLHQVAERESHADAPAANGAWVERPRRAQLEVLAPAKLNPWLRVLARRADGFHEVDLALAAIDLFDLLAVEAREPLVLEPGATLRALLQVSGPAATADIPLDENNLALLAAQRVLGQAQGWRGALTLKLAKHIPSRAGLGGGSSDAAAALIACARWLAWLGQDDHHEQWGAWLAELGSDTVFFGTQAGAARARGRGEQLQPLDSAGLAAHVLVVTPDVECPTGRVFQAWTAQAPANVGTNDLQPAALAAVPALRDVHRALTMIHPGPWHLSGSGSSWFVALASQATVALSDGEQAPAWDLDTDSGRAAAQAYWAKRVDRVLPSARYVGVHRPFAGGFHGSSLGVRRGDRADSEELGA